MNRPIADVVDELHRLPLAELRARYAALHGEESRCRHREHLVRRIVWRLQADAEGGLPERARRRALEIADDRDLRLLAPRRPSPALADPVSVRRIAQARPEGLPAPGSELVRAYRGRTIRVRVLEDGFEMDGRHFQETIRS